MSPPDLAKQFYSLDEIAQLLGISRALARKLFPIVKLGRRVTVRKADFDAVIEGARK